MCYDTKYLKSKCFQIAKMSTIVNKNLFFFLIADIEILEILFFFSNFQNANCHINSIVFLNSKISRNSTDFLIDKMAPN